MNLHRNNKITSESQWVCFTLSSRLTRFFQDTNPKNFGLVPLDDCTKHSGYNRKIHFRKTCSHIIWWSTMVLEFARVFCPSREPHHVENFFGVGKKVRARCIWEWMKNHPLSLDQSFGIRRCVALSWYGSAVRCGAVVNEKRSHIQSWQ